MLALYEPAATGKKPAFTVKPNPDVRKVNQLQAHLLTVAKQWSQRNHLFFLDKTSHKIVDVSTLEKFKKALINEKLLYCLDDGRSKPDEVMIYLVKQSDYEHIVVRRRHSLTPVFTVSLT